MNATLAATLIAQLADGGWSFTYEYPGYLSHRESPGTDESNIEVTIGTDAGRWHGQYMREGTCIGGWDFCATFASDAALAAALLVFLRTAVVE